MTQPCEQVTPADVEHIGELIETARRAKRQRRKPADSAATSAAASEGIEDATGHLD